MSFEPKLSEQDLIDIAAMNRSGPIFHNPRDFVMRESTTATRAAAAMLRPALNRPPTAEELRGNFKVRSMTGGNSMFGKYPTHHVFSRADLEKSLLADVNKPDVFVAGVAHPSVKMTPAQCEKYVDSTLKNALKAGAIVPTTAARMEPADPFGEDLLAEILAEK